MIKVRDKTFDTSVALKYLNLQESAERRGIEFSLSIQSIINLKKAKRCFYTGMALTDINRSVDRIDNEKGYIKGNVVACDKAFNMLKGGLTLEEIRQIHIGINERKIRQRRSGPSRSDLIHGTFFHF